MNRTLRLWMGLFLTGTLIGMAPVRLWSDDPKGKASPSPDASPAAEDSPPAEPELPVPPDARRVIEAARRAVVVVSFSDRNGKALGIGSGFALTADGLIATNLHVIGEARPIAVRTLDGKSFDVREIHATDKSQDLAILKINATGLPTLPLGDSDALREGEPLVAIGNPEGLEHSVVTGVSGVRKDYEGMDLIQLAMPIERGNSGGPVLNMQGEVVGLVTLKHMQTRNLGFAVTANRLKPLIEKPNPIAISKWLTIGVINRRLWDAPDDTIRWTQHAGTIRVSGGGASAGIGGRSLCLARADVPEVPYEVGVFVRMDEDDGAAGLVFHSDGGNEHFGFYPSSGKLRLTRFDGPTVYQWSVLEDTLSTAFRPGEWNHIKVRVETDGFRCYCNDELIYTSHDTTYRDGRVGLAKFRHTTAEFKEFRLAKSLPPSRPDSQLAERIVDQVDALPVHRPPTEALVDSLLADSSKVGTVLQDQARLLEARAKRLRELAGEVHAERIRRKLASLFSSSTGDIDLLHAGLLIASLDNPDLDVQVYRDEVDAMAAEFLATVEKESPEAERMEKFNRWMFEVQGFHGSRTSYHAAANSYLNQVIDDREGLPITLSILYIELARRVGLDVVGIGLPGHFVVQWRPKAGEPKLIDPFDRGAVLGELDAMLRVEGSGIPWHERFLEPQTPRQITERMLRNLLNVANRKQDSDAALRYIDTILALDPENPVDRLYKAVLCLNTGRIDEGLAETNWVIERDPAEIAMEQVYRLKSALEARRIQSAAETGPAADGQ